MINSSSTYVALIAGLLSFFTVHFPLFPIYLTTLGLDGKIITKTNKKLLSPH